MQAAAADWGPAASSGQSSHLHILICIIWSELNIQPRNSASHHKTGDWAVVIHTKVDNISMLFCTAPEHRSTGSEDKIQTLPR